MSEEEDDPRVKRIFQNRRGFWTSEGERAFHVLRAICRLKALTKATAARRDFPGMEDVDVEALSGKAWKKFRDSLAPCEWQKVMIYMCGAASSHTRGGNHDFTCDPYCPCCGEAFWPSVRHCVT
eukprot:9480391-Pyramimonas_sp.AAC.1